MDNNTTSIKGNLFSRGGEDFIELIKKLMEDGREFDIHITVPSRANGRTDKTVNTQVVPNKPLKHDATNDIIPDTEHTKATLEEFVAEYIHKLGIPANLKGYVYIKEALLYMLCNPTKDFRITKVLYPMVAKTYDTQPNRVERGIRHAIEKAWSTGFDNHLLEKMFDDIIGKEKTKPTNSEFLSIMAERIKIDYKKKMSQII